MENAEKVQESAPEEVQQEAELNLNEEKEETNLPNDQQEAETQVEEDPPEEIVSDEAATDQLPEAKAEEVSPNQEEIIQEEAPVTEDADANETVPASASEETPVVEQEEVPKEKPSSDIDESIEQVDAEEEEEQEDIEEESLDFENATKEELCDKLKEIRKEERIPRVDRVLKAVKPRFDELFEAEKTTALNKFELEGNDPNAFEFHGDEIDREFNTIYGELRSKRNRFYRDLESQKEENLQKKQNLLETLRQLVDGEESNSSINSVKDLQAEWKKVGPVPGAHNKTLWANYNALLDRFYDQRSIYFELKDLDRKKNLTLKEELCERAEALAKQEDLKAAIVQLNELHEEYKHIGPVPKDDQETLWQRFKGASDAVYARRKEFFDGLKVEFEANYEKKKELAVEAESFLSFDSDSIKEWNSKTKEIQDLQKRWEVIGGLPRDKAKAINKQFWGSFKKFFNKKNQFFKQLEGKRDENLKLKEDLVRRAEELKESQDWNRTTQKYKQLQQEWKEVGPVPEKMRNEIYKQFKTACDYFFDQRRAQNSEQEKEYEENLKLKLQICDQIEAIVDQEEINLDDVYDLIDNHAQLGFVPRNAIKKERSRFEQATEKILSMEELEDGDRADLRNHIQTSRLRNTPGGDRKLQQQEHSIKRKINELENDISTWNTNMEFFAASATADKLKADLQKKIEDAEGELASLKSQLSSMSS